MIKTPPDWVLLEAARRADWGMQDVDWLRAEYLKITSRRAFIFRALCDMIQKYEQPPVDRKLLCAREASAQLDDNGEFDYWRSGDGDGALTCCLRSLELYEQGFGQ